MCDLRERHVIKINDLKILLGSYTKAQMESVELISDPIESIAIFANEYIPTHFSDDKTYIQYILTINGIDYNIVPINSNKEGTKVIRNVDNITSDSYVEYIKESIKSAKLTIIINTPDNSSTPYVSNVKICYGKATTK